MKKIILFTALALGLPVQALDTYKAKIFGSKLRLDGDSSVHKWKATTGVLGGSFSVDTAALSKLGSVEAKAEVKIPVRQIKSGKKKMDEVMYGETCFNVKEYPRIVFTLNRLEVKQASGTVSLCQAGGSITIHGVKKPIEMALIIVRSGRQLTVKTLQPVEDLARKKKAEADRENGKNPDPYDILKMSDFKITPPSPQLPAGKIVTKDEIKITFEWVVAR